MVLFGRGDNYWMTGDYENDRKTALRDRRLFTDDELEELDVSFPQGGGKTNPNFFIIEVEALSDSAPTSISISKAFPEFD